jgi:hypothetical protein
MCDFWLVLAANPSVYSSHHLFALEQGAPHITVLLERDAVKRLAQAVIQSCKYALGRLIGHRIHIIDSTIIIHCR